MKRTILFLTCFVGCGARTPLPEPTTRTADEVVVPPHEVRSVAIGGRHACAVKGDGSVYCWGAGDLGQLGDGTRTTSARPVRVSGLEKAVEVTAGGLHSCARLADGSVHCWGSRSVGQTGDGKPLLEGGNVLPTPVIAVGIADATSVVAGDAHTCVITGGAVQCFGSNDFGQLGDDREERSPAAVRVHGASNANGLALGASHSCMRGEEGEVRCWGSNENNQLSTFSAERCGSFFCARHALDVEIGPVIGLAAGGDQTCAIVESGNVACWGLRIEGESATPVPVESLRDVAELSIARSHLCARNRSGTVFCLGDDTHGQLGFDTGSTCPHGTGACTTEAGIVRGLPKAARAIVTGGSSSCAILTDGTLWCWGGNGSGQLGDGTTADRVTPKQLDF